MIFPACKRADISSIRMGGFLATYLRGVSEQWLMIAPAANPAMLDMLRDRDRLPYRNLVPWAGEFAGKFLTGAVQVLRLNGNQKLRRYLQVFVSELVSLQAPDGYLGPWPSPDRLTNIVHYPEQDNMNTWDSWGHYHIMLGLLLWYEATSDPAALDCVRRIGDLMCDIYLGDCSPRLVDTGCSEMNLAPVHSLCLLYRQIPDARYLQLARQLSAEFAALDSSGKPLAGDYLNSALDGQEFFQMPKPRWESLHPIMGMVELYYLTGDSNFRTAFEHIWWSIVKLDRHNNGGFSSGEQAQGNPYHPGAIETCCTIAWIALSVEMLRLTADSRVADELELSTLNSVTGMHSASGRWVTYNTPMDGVRRASAHDIVFQAREGMPELNCCSVNGARGFGMISEWALLQDAEGVLVNWYGPCTMTVELSGSTVTLRQKTDYPRNGKILLHIAPSHPVAFSLGLRIPHWSKNTQIKLNGIQLDTPPPGSYARISRTWIAGDSIEIVLDFSLHYWVGKQECAGKVSLYRGPLLLAYDRRFNTMDPEDIPRLDVSQLSGLRRHWKGRNPPLLLMEFTGVKGQPLLLCDFGSNGEGGSPYYSWLPITGEANSPFNQESPLRNRQVGAKR